MFEESEQKRSSRKVGKDQEWLKTDLTSSFSVETTTTLYNDLIKEGAITSVKRNEQETTTCAFPDFEAAATLRGKGIERLHERIREELRRSLQPLAQSPSACLFQKQEAIWRRIVMATEGFYSSASLKKTLAKLSEEEMIGDDVQRKKKESEKKDGPKSADSVLIEIGIKTGLSLVFSLLRQVWVQASWQQQLHQALTASGAIGEPHPLTSHTHLLATLTYNHEVTKFGTYLTYH